MTSTSGVKFTLSYCRSLLEEYERTQYMSTPCNLRKRLGRYLPVLSLSPSLNNPFPCNLYRMKALVRAFEVHAEGALCIQHQHDNDLPLCIF